MIIIRKIALITYNKTPIKVETIEQYKEYVDAVKYWQSIKKYDGKRKKGSM